MMRPPIVQFSLPLLLLRRLVLLPALLCTGHARAFAQLAVFEGRRSPTPLQLISVPTASLQLFLVFFGFVVDLCRPLSRFLALFFAP